jgi:hypothetical protein
MSHPTLPSSSLSLTTSHSSSLLLTHSLSVMPPRKRNNAPPALSSDPTSASRHDVEVHLRITAYLESLPGGEPKKDVDSAIIDLLIRQLSIVWSSDDVRQLFRDASKEGNRSRKGQDRRRDVEASYERYCEELESFSGTRKQKTEFIEKNKGIVRQHESLKEPLHSPLILAQIGLDSAYIRWKGRKGEVVAGEKEERKRQRTAERESKEEERKAEKEREEKSKEEKKAAKLEAKRKKVADKEESLRLKRVRAVRELEGTMAQRFKKAKERTEEELGFLRESREMMRDNKAEKQRKRARKASEEEEDPNKENDDGNVV